MAEPQRKAVPLRRTRGYRLLVWALRCQPVALMLGGLAVASTGVDVAVLTDILAICLAAVLIPTVVLGLTGMIMLYAGGLMPRDINRRQAMVGMLWRDAVSPLRRR
ncbi:MULTISPECIES: hypothetical protein [unclassified Solwaraspora]|uniref:hypothetical protein n=1 Tax=unclassified Solwaraspora TaxID=2627926 RepID=UPI00259AEE18|nr:hypothetical protein [Solwaraspora sp. WMMA2056]WJK43073.1 hypothetical protein O7608_12155 [Solwaraspora sp. WMMA2056]